ncbi:hypothetical protein ZWY2020_055235 [Hordeum vulgare]|nr:hypothetical protein ZWY2020_055235 [Hordeum vulgare]
MRARRHAAELGRLRSRRARPAVPPGAAEARFSTNTSPRWPLAQPMRLLGHNGEINTIQGNLNWMRSREATIQSPVWRGRENELPFGDPTASESANLDNAAEAYKNHPTLSVKYRSHAIKETSDGFVYVASEVVEGSNERRGRLGPGMMITVDLEDWSDSKPHESSQVLENTEVKENVSFSKTLWNLVARKYARSIKACQLQSSPVMDNETILRHQQKKATFCIGDDIPLAVLCQKPHMLFDYFKQRFAQVTGNILEVGPENADQDPKLKPKVLSTYFNIRKGLDGSLENAIKALCEEADAAAALGSGSQLLVLSDRSEALPPCQLQLLLTLSVQHHQFACLIGYGASAICPYLALETCRQWRLSNKTVKLMRNGQDATVTIEQAKETLSSYCGAQIFEIYGLGQEVVDLAFCGSVSKIGGLTLNELGRETLSFWVRAFSEDTLKEAGKLRIHPIQTWRTQSAGVLTDVVDGYSATLPHLKGLQSGTHTSAIKQVASGRFGVTPTFLVNAEQIEIKIAQGAKPGEGGQLPGKKVSAYIARLRNSKPGVPLISPPPHHDIYSIEDLAQLIFDLHQINPKAKVSVKLVAEAGIGTVASGVSKANADVIQISGHDGGTGASPISSIKHAGGPWELGLTETHQTLIQNGLRERVVLRVDGGFRSGLDVLLAAAMGADEYGFGSVAMIATGCVMYAFATQTIAQLELLVREKSYALGFLAFLLGYEKLDDIIGRTDLLQPKHISLVKTQHIDLAYLLMNSGLPKWSSSQIRSQDVHSNGPVLDETILADPEVSDAIENEKEEIKNFKHFRFTGSAGQSFGCFLTPGMNVRLVGEANDYVGKGMAGGELVVVPVDDTGFVPEDAAIVGNTCLYGATGGQVFVRGKTGERFAVRNSLGQAVVEGTGDHCCEYMTGGCVVVLGKVGRNVAAGMTGGLAYMLDEDDTLVPKVNKEIVKMQRVNAPAGQMQLKGLIEAYVEKTGSTKGAKILSEWEAYLPLFWQLVPPSEEDSPEACAEFERVLARQKTAVQSAK